MDFGAPSVETVGISWMPQLFVGCWVIREPGKQAVVRIIGEGLVQCGSVTFHAQEERSLY